MKRLPILEEKSLIDAINLKLIKISAALEKEFDHIDDPGLFQGTMGLAVFFYEYDGYAGEEKYKDLALRCIEKSIQKINEGFSVPTFSDGISGIAWTLNQFVDKGFIDENSMDSMHSMEPFFTKFMKQEYAYGNFDYLHGAGGISLMILNDKKFPDREKHLRFTLTELDRLGIRAEEGVIKWPSVLDPKTGKRGVNLGMAHGMASILILLSYLHREKVNDERTRTLLKGAIRYLFGKEQDVDRFMSAFPSWACMGERPVSSRLAWCYGDPGIGVSIWLAGRAIGRTDWQDWAVQIMLHAAQRTDPKINCVNDAGICHGAAGLTHVFNMMYQHSDVIEFRFRAQYWLEKCLKMDTFDDGPAGYKKYVSENQYESDFGFIQGIAGLGLVLISALSEGNPWWEDALLMGTRI